MKGGPNQFGWAGPYLNTPEIGADPWGNRYMINVCFLDPSPGALDAKGQVKYSVWAISAGPNGIIETSFAQPVTSGGMIFGDDVATIIQSISCRAKTKRPSDGKARAYMPDRKRAANRVLMKCWSCPNLQMS